MKAPRRPRLHISTKRFVLRPFRASDYITWRAAYENMLPKQNEFDEEKKSVKELSRAEFSKLLRKYKAWQKSEDILVFAIFEKSTGRFMGTVPISLLIRFNVQSARLAYFIFNNYWKHGYGREVADAAIDFCFQKLKLHRLEAEIQPHNRSSIALARALGMQYEGLRRKAVYFNRKWHDHVIYALVAEDRGLTKVKPIYYKK